MTTTLTQVSNVFNLLCQLDARLLNYHFGWQWDINKEIDNNFDPGNQTGRLFPAVQMDVPDYFQALEQPSYDGTKEEIKVLLYFYDEQDYNNDSSAKTINLVEQWTNLKTIAEDFMANYLEAIGPKKYNVGFISNPRYTQRSNLHNDRLIVWEVEFILTHIAPCTIASSKIDLDLLPDILQLQDIERITEPPPPCFSFDLDGINELIQIPLDTDFELLRSDSMTFEAWVKFDNLGIINRLINKYGVVGARGILFQVEGSEISFHLQNNGGLNGLILYTVGANITVGVWYHLMVTYDGSSSPSGVNFYKNGILQAIFTNSNTLSAPIYSPNNVNVGGILPSGGFFCDALFNVFRWWKSELNQAEVVYQYNNREGTPAQESNLLLNPDIDASTWNGSEFDIPDLTGITTGYTTVNAEEEDKVEECP